MKNILNVKQFNAGSCYSYILSCQNDAVIIDSHISLKENYFKYLKVKNLKLKYILDTHTHADHFSLAAVLKKEIGVPVVMHEKAISEVANQRVRDNEELELGGAKLKIIYSPGHTDDSISIYSSGKLFTGDVLLIGSVGRTDFQNGSPGAMFDTLQRFKELPFETVVLPGHDYNEEKSSTIALEIKNNRFLKQNNKDEFINDIRSKVIPKPFNIDNIIRVNRKGEATFLEMVSPKDAYALTKNAPQVRLLDVRSSSEFSQEHIKDSINVPIDTLLTKINDLSQAKETYLVLCRTGNRSPMAADMLIQSGIHSVKVMDGGLTRWAKDGLPVVKGQGGVSLERQVRAIAGILILSGIVLAWSINPWFLGISVFVSCGLIYAGITDNCLMGMLLMKLPYNKKLYRTKLGGGTCSIGK